MFVRTIVRFSFSVFGVLSLCAAARAQWPGGGKTLSGAKSTYPPSVFLGRRAPGLDGSRSYFAITPETRACFLQDRVQFRTRTESFQVEFMDSTMQHEIAGEEPTAARVNYLIGNDPQNWVTDVSTYRKLTYRSLYSGIDAQFSFSGTRLKSEFVIAPGTDPRRIAFRYTGLGRPHIDEHGDLKFVSGQGEFREEAPTAVQWRHGRRIEISVRFALSEGDVVRFELGTFDETLPLIIDPAVSYSSYLGGHGDNGVTAIAADSSGNVYLTGWTDSVDFPVTGALQGRNAGGVDAFVVKMNAAGNTLIYATYIGGSGEDRGLGIAVDGSGSAYITGFTTSVDFPTSLPVQSRLLGSRDAFVLKLNALGNALIFSTYLGGTGSDSGNAIAVDSQGNAYAAGSTASSDFPTRTPFQASNAGGQDAFLAKISSSGALLHSTYLGGSGDDRAAAIAIDASGSAYVTGGTFSNNFPTTAGVFQPATGGGQDAFVAKLSPSGSSLVYSTYLGGNGGSAGAPETGAGIAVDVQGNAFVAGMTSSMNFPVVAAIQPVMGGGTENAFVSKLNPLGTALVYSTYFGGSTMDYANAVAVDGAGNAYVAGYTGSTDLPLSSPIQATLAGGYDAFVFTLNTAGSALTFATYYGGTGLDAANGIALDGLGNVYVAGLTLSSDFPITGGVQSSIVGYIAAFVLKLNFAVQYLGNLDAADCNNLAGWAADKNRLNQSITVDIYDGTTLILAGVPANLSRPDVGTYLGDNGLHGFSVPTPASLKDGNTHSVWVKFGGTATALGGAPKSLSCSAGPLYTGSLDLADCNTIAGWAADKNRLNQSITVDIYDGTTLILAGVPANLSRPDVGSFLGDNGLHGFSIATPASLKDGNTHSLSVKFGGTATALGSSPKSLSCSAGALYTGTLDLADCNNIAGWAADQNRLNQSITVDLYDGNTLLLAGIPANLNRPDVGSYLGDNGLHGFSIATPASLKTSTTHSVSVKFGGATTQLSSSPKSLFCP